MIESTTLNTEQKANLKLTFIGGGNMASAILDGCLSKGFSAKFCHIIELDPAKRAWLKEHYGVNVCADLHDLKDEIPHQDIILLAVKPQQMQELAVNLMPLLAQTNKSPQPLIISIAAGIRLVNLQQWLGGYKNIVRTMPNMAALIHAGMTGLTALPSVSTQGRDCAETLMNSVGNILWFKDEAQLDAVTAISGSGPAYVFYFIEALQEAAETLGLSPEQSRLLALSTFSGASRLAAFSTDSVTALREKVTSKGGTTEAALNCFDNLNIKQHIIQAVQSAEKRAKELGE